MNVYTFDVQSRAFRWLLQELAREAKEAWKEVLRDYNQWQRTGNENIKLALPEKIQRAKTSSLAVVDNLDVEGLTPELNKQLAKADFSKVSETKRAKIIKRIIEDLANTEPPEDEIQKLEQAFSHRLADLDAKKREILNHGGISSYLRHYMEDSDPGALAANPTSFGLSKLRQLAFREMAEPRVTCSQVKNYCFYLMISALVRILTADVWEDTYEAFFYFIWAGFTCEELLQEYCGWR